MRFAPMILALVLPAAVAAQTSYRRTPGDTLRYEEQTKMVNTSNTPMGDLQTEMISEGSTAFRFRGGDSVTVTLHPTKLTVTTQMGDMSPGVGALAGKTFDMTMGPRGDVKLISSLDLPPEMQALGNLASNFNDYFVRLPEARLRVGLEWTDTLTVSDTTSALRANVERIARYKVEKDTVIDGQKAWVIASTGTSDTQTTGTMSQGGMDIQVDVKMQSNETGRTLFTHEGVMLSREIKSTLSGTSRMVTPAMPIEMAVKGGVDITRRLVR